MAHLNLRERVIETTIAYVSAEAGSGARNLAEVRLHPEKGRAGALEEQVVDGWKSVSLDWRPREGLKLNDCELMVRLVSGVSGAPDTVRHALVDADAYVLVLESDPGSSERNGLALSAIRDAMAHTTRKRRPVIVQVNQSGDGDEHVHLDVVIEEEWPRLEARVAKGDGVMETLQRAVDVVVESLQGKDAAAGAPRGFGSPRAEGNPLLGALRQILVATVTDEISALEVRLVEKLQREMATSESVATCTARLERVASAMTELGARAASANERMGTLEDKLNRLDESIAGLARHTGPGTPDAASRADVERIEARVVSDVKSHREAVNVQLASFEAWMERIESTVIEAAERAAAGLERTASRADVERVEARLVTESGAHKDAVVNEIKESRKTVRDEVLRATTTVTQPLQRSIDKLATAGAEADVAGAIQRCGAKTDGVRGQVDALVGESRTVAAQVDEMATQVEHVDARVDDINAQVKQLDTQVGRRLADVRDALRAATEKSDGRLLALQTEVTGLTEEIRKRNKSWFG